MKMVFSCTLNAIIRGSLCSGIDQFRTLFLLFISYFTFEFVSGKLFFPSPPFPPSFFFTRRSTGGGGGGEHGPLVPRLATPVYVAVTTLCFSLRFGSPHFDHGCGVIRGVRNGDPAGADPGL